MERFTTRSVPYGFNIRFIHFICRALHIRALYHPPAILRLTGRCRGQTAKIKDAGVERTNLVG